MSIIKGYKGTDANMCCRGHKFQMGRNVYEGEIQLKWKGFHFQDKLQDVFQWYPSYHNNRYFEVISSGDTQTENGLVVTDNIELIRELSEQEIKEMLVSLNLGYNVVEACYPVNPLEMDNELTQIDIDNLEKWQSVWKHVEASVWQSVGLSVWQSVGQSVEKSVLKSVNEFVWLSVGESVRQSVDESVWQSVWQSVRQSVVDSVYAYISSLFPNIKKWKYIDHEKGVNPFQSGIDLWRRGFVPSFDGKVWRLHSGKNMKVVYMRGGK